MVDEKDRDLLAGTRYRILREIGRGSSSVVYEAEHVDLGRKVALKVLAAEKSLSVEFSEHRKYTPGDDLKTLDWNVYAKTGKFFVKKFRAETNMTGYLVMDLSKSMGYTFRQELTKFDYGVCLAAALLTGTLCGCFNGLFVTRARAADHDADAIEAAGVDPAARAETLDLAAYVRLAEAIPPR